MRAILTGLLPGLHLHKVKCPSSVTELPQDNNGIQELLPRKTVTSYCLCCGNSLIDIGQVLHILMWFDFLVTPLPPQCGRYTKHECLL